MNSLVQRFILPLLFLSILLQGCVAVQSFPAAARAGDTIMLAVGSPEGMKKSNTTARFVSDADASVVDLPIRSIIRIRPDQTSEAALYDSILNAEPYHTGHSQWLTLVFIDLPENITVGTGIINIVSSASYGTLAQGINDIPLSLEILEGAGVSNDFSYNNNFGGVAPYDLAMLEALPQAVFKMPNAGKTLLQFAAAEIKVRVPMESFGNRSVRVVADDFYTKNPKDQVQMNWSRNADEFTVNFISPKGSMQARQLRFSIVLRKGESFSTVYPPQVVSVKIYDIDGNQVRLSGDTDNKDLFNIGIE